MPEYQNLSDKSRIKSIWLFDIFTGEEFEFESIASAIKNLNIDENFVSACSSLSYCANRGGIFKHYLVKSESTNYRLPAKQLKIYNSLTNTIYKNLKDASNKTGNSTDILKQ